MEDQRDNEIEIIEADTDNNEDLSEKAMSIQTVTKAEAPAKYDPLRRYFYEVGQHPLLSREEANALAIRFQEDGDQDAAYELVTSNLRLVIKIAMDYHRYWSKNLLDLIQEGNIGLMQAVTKFNPYRGVKFSYYSSFWIKAYILKFILDNWHLVKLGTTQAQRKLFFNLKKEKEKLTAQGIEPGPKLLAERLNVKEKEVIEMDARLDSWEVSLDAKVQDDSKESYINYLPSTEPETDDILAGKQIRDILHEKIMSFVEGLNERDRELLDERILAEKPATLQVMGEKFKVSRERVRQLEERIKKNLKIFLLDELPDFKQDDFLSAIDVEE